MNIGIICEYNPFHYGHLYQINELKRMYPDSTITIVMSGWITERGDLSLIDKFKKADIALYYGVDLVVELPYKFIQSADYFAKGAIEILNKLGCNYIAFGSESNDLEKLSTLAKTQINNKKFDKLVKEYMKSESNYPTALNKALKDICGIDVNDPNDILGVCYLKEIIKNKYNINPILIKRNSNYNSKKIEGKITSATSIRELLKNNKNIKKYVPKHSYKNLKDVIFLDDYFDLIKYKIISTDISVYQGIDENLKNRILSSINYSDNLDELIGLIKSKKITYNRVKRILTYILLDIKKDSFNLDLEYMRILGFNNNGKSILNRIKKDIDIPILTKYDPKYLSNDLKITNILSLNKKIKDKKSFIEKEYKEKAIIY